MDKTYGEYELSNAACLTAWTCVYSIIGLAPQVSHFIPSEDVARTFSCLGIKK